MTLDDELRDAIRSLNDAKYEYNEAWRIYEEWYDRIRATEPAPGDETQGLNPDLERAYHKLWRAREAVERAAAPVLRVQAGLAADLRRRAAAPPPTRPPPRGPPILPPGVASPSRSPRSRRRRRGCPPSLAFLDRSASSRDSGGGSSGNAMAKKQDWSPRVCLDVWIVVHDHRHGTDLSVFRTEDSALKAAAEIALGDAEENEVDELKELRALLRRG